MQIEQPLEVSETSVNMADEQVQHSVNTTRISYSAFRSWYWLFPPFLAIIAYATVLRVGFLADDLILLMASKQGLLGARLLLPSRSWTFYRPVGQLLTWDFGWHLFGFNPLPFHIESLLLHAAVSLVLGLWLAEISSRPWLGWLAGVLFAVFPLHLEAVAWLASQWDLLATLFGLLAAWLFTRWWKSAEPRHRLWLLLFTAVVCYAVGLFSKESLLTFVPLIGISAWSASPPKNIRNWRVLIAALVPFGLVEALNVTLRLIRWGSIGGYAGVRTDYLNFFWSGFTNQVSVLLSPINSTVFNIAITQLVGAIAAAFIALGTVLFARRLPRVFILAGAWLILTILPLLNLAVSPLDLQENRYLYLPAVGYCTLVASIIFALISSLQRRRAVVISMVAVGCVLFLSIVACWAQLRPWHTTTVMAQEIDEQTRTLIPPDHNRLGGMIWYVKDAPDTYEGAYLYRLGMGTMRDFTTNGDGPAIENVGSVEDAPLRQGATTQDAFVMSFAYSSTNTNYRVDTLSGITRGTPPPEAGATAEADLQVWNFGACSPEALKQWAVQGARSHCVPDGGIAFESAGSDPHLVGPLVPSITPPDKEGFIRLRVAASYPPVQDGGTSVTQWYWSESGTGFSERKSIVQPALQDGRYHVYWTFIPAAAVATGISQFRFDPINSATSSFSVKWIAVDTVK